MDSFLDFENQLCAFTKVNQAQPQRKSFKNSYLILHITNLYRQFFVQSCLRIVIKLEESYIPYILAY